MTITSRNPHRPSDIVLTFDPSNASQVAAAIDRSADAQKEWSLASAHDRSACLMELAFDLAARSTELEDLMVREIGKPLLESRAEVHRAVSILKYYSQAALLPDGETLPTTDGTSWLMSRRFPVGVCGVVTPWNFPVAIPLWKCVPAWAFGNSVVWKPASHSTAVGLFVGEIANRSLPPGVLEVVVGDSNTGTALVRHPTVSAVSFTGSTAVGQMVAAEVVGRGARVQCEMGGQNASIVLASADLEKAARAIAYAAMGYAGQKCTATSRIIVQVSVLDEFRDALVGAVEGLKVVDPASSECEVGPVIDDVAVQTATDAIRGCENRILTRQAGVDAEGYYVFPTLVELTNRDHVLAQQEVFAPLAAILAARDAEEALAIANEVPQGLVGAIFSRDLGQILELAPRLLTGLVKVNAPTSGVDFHAPFGGIKASGIGPKEQGTAAQEFFTESRTWQISA